MASPCSMEVLLLCGKGAHMKTRKTTRRLLALVVAAILACATIALGGCTSCSSSQASSGEATTKEDTPKKKTEKKKEKDGKEAQKEYTVPNVVSLTQTDAEKAILASGLAARYTGDPAGNVVAQDVDPGTMVEPNTLITVTLQKSVVMVTVPDLVGMSPTSAEGLLSDLNLVLDLDGGIHGTIVSQSPEAGTQVEERTTVTATVDSSDFGWHDASSAAKAAKGAGLSDFSVQKSVTIGDKTYKKPTVAADDGDAPFARGQGASPSLGGRGLASCGCGQLYFSEAHPVEYA